MHLDPGVLIRQLGHLSGPRPAPKGCRLEGSIGRSAWCRRRDSNWHALRRRILNPLRLAPTAGTAWWVSPAGCTRNITPSAPAQGRRSRPAWSCAGGCPRPAAWCVIGQDSWRRPAVDALRCLA